MLHFMFRGRNVPDLDTCADEFEDPATLTTIERRGFRLERRDIRRDPIAEHEHADTTVNLADPYTKSLGKTEFLSHRRWQGFLLPKERLQMVRVRTLEKVEHKDKPWMHGGDEEELQALGARGEVERSLGRSVWRDVYHTSYSTPP